MPRNSEPRESSPLTGSRTSTQQNGTQAGSPVANSRDSQTNLGMSRNVRVQGYSAESRTRRQSDTDAKCPPTTGAPPIPTNTCQGIGRDAHKSLAHHGRLKNVRHCAARTCEHDMRHNEIANAISRVVATQHDTVITPCRCTSRLEKNRSRGEDTTRCTTISG